MENKKSGNIAARSEQFNNDKYQFSVLLQNLYEDNPLVTGDGNEYLICRSAVGLPTWIWSREGISDGAVFETERAIEEDYLAEGLCKFTCKEELFNRFSARFKALISTSIKVQKMGFLLCRNLRRPKACDGVMRLATDADIATLTKYYIDECRELYGEERKYNETFVELAKRVRTSRFYVWVNSNGTIVSTAMYHTVEDCARINHVYTVPSQRAKGYAANLIYNICIVTMNKGRVPLLYTDYEYLPSNRAYKNVGFEEGQPLVNFFIETRTYKMNLNAEPFDMIRRRVKTIELRLYDEKRRAIMRGDIIEFTNSSDEAKKLRCRVINVYPFDSFEDLYKALPLLKCGYTDETINAASPKDMNKYYSDWQIERNGVVGIELKLL